MEKEGRIILVLFSAVFFLRSASSNNRYYQSTQGNVPTHLSEQDFRNADNALEGDPIDTRRIVRPYYYEGDIKGFGPTSVNMRDFVKTASGFQ